MRISCFALVALALFLPALPSAAKPVKPDLSISSEDVVFSPSPPSTDTPLTVTLTVHNAGAAVSKACAALAKITRKPDRAVKVTAQVPAIPAGGSAQISFAVGSHASGTYNLLVKVDTGNRVKETAEGNNKALLFFEVKDPNPFVGQAAAAAYGTLSQLTTSLLDAVNKGTAGLGNAGNGAFSESALTMALLSGGRSETTRDCGKAGAFDYEVAMDFTHIRPGTLTAMSPAPGGVPCEEWLHQTGTSPDLGSFSRYTGRFSVDLSYRSNNPFDPGFTKPETLVLKTGDGVPGTMNPLPDFVTEAHLLTADGLGGSLDYILATQDADYTATVTVLGLGADGVPNHMRLDISGALTTAGGAAAEAATASYSGYQVEVTYGEEGDAKMVTFVTRGSVALANTANPAWDVSLNYQNFTRTHQTTAGQTEVSVGGTVEVASSCITGAITLATAEPVVYTRGEMCPNAGKISVTSPLGSATLLFFSDGSMGVDDGSDGSVDHLYEDCLEAGRPRCP